MICGACTVALGCASQAIAAVPTSDDRLALMVSGATLTGTNGGWGTSATWLHNFSADTIMGLGAEHQSIGDADWNFGTLNITHGFGEADRRTTLYLEAHEGSGKDAAHSYDYSIVAGGAYQNLTRQLTLLFEDKQIDVDTDHGNLPKIGFQYLWSPAFSTTLSYAYSVSGTLDSKIVSGRIDGYGTRMNYFAGVANGRAAPILINEVTNDRIPGGILHEYYVGAGRSFSRVDTTVVLDYVKLSGSEHITLTFNCILHKRQGGSG